MLSLMIVDAPPVGTLIAAEIAAEPRLGVDALVLAVPPQRPLHRVKFSTIRADVRILLPVEIGYGRVMIVQSTLTIR